MASTILMPNPCFNTTSLVSYNSNNNMSWIPNSHSFGQVCLPKQTNELVFSSHNISSRSQSFLSSIITPTLSSSKLTRTTNTGSTTTACDVSKSTLCHIWREIQGCDNWEDFVEPLHPLLRQEIIRYGEFVTACYKAFDLDPNSKRHLTCKYGKKSLLKQVGMENSGYQVTKYIYATPDINSIPIQNASSCGRWIGYVAVSSDDEVKRLGRRDILVTFRGTVTNHEWIANLMSSLTPARLDPHNPRPEVKVESGFLSLYTSNEIGNKFGLVSCREQLLSEVSRLLNKYKNEEVSITSAGHSMGSSLAVLLGYDIAELGLNKRSINPNKDIPVTVFSFGGPRVGNVGFKQRCEELGVKVLRVVNVNDPITKVPGVFLNENNFRVEFPWSYSCYSHVGVELALEFFNVQNPSCVHDLESYLNLLKCPVLGQVEDVQIDDKDEDLDDNQENLLDLLSRAKELLPTNFDMLPLKNAATNMVNLVQSHSCEFLIDDNVLECMNSLALCIFL